MRIDWWTLGLQTVNVAVLAWLLGKFFWRPVAAMIRERGEAARRMLEEAEAKRAEADAARAAAEQARARDAGERDAILAGARADAERLRQQALERLASETAAERAAAAAAIERDHAASERTWSEHAARLAIDIATRLLAQLDAAPLSAAFLERLLRELQALPDERRRGLLADGAALTAITAAPLDAEERAHCRSRLAAALGGEVQIAFDADPGLIAGIELRATGFAVANSWRADLARIGDGLRHVDPA